MRWRWWDGTQWTDATAPRESHSTAQAVELPAKQRSRFVRELVGDKEERAAAKAKRLAARDEAKELLRAQWSKPSPRTPRASH